MRIRSSRPLPITESVRLNADLSNCPGDGIIIGADNIVLDGNGHAIDPKSALFVGGSELDFSSDLQHGGFKVSNPNAVVTCSCGESFAA